MATSAGLITLAEVSRGLQKVDFTEHATLKKGAKELLEEIKQLIPILMKYEEEF